MSVLLGQVVANWLGYVCDNTNDANILITTRLFFPGKTVMIEKKGYEF